MKSVHPYEPLLTSRTPAFNQGHLFPCLFLRINPLIQILITASHIAHHRRSLKYRSPSILASHPHNLPHANNLIQNAHF